jgi:hypothetical protein
MVLDVNENVCSERQRPAVGWCHKSLDFPKQFNFTESVKETTVGGFLHRRVIRRFLFSFQEE